MNDRGDESELTDQQRALIELFFFARAMLAHVEPQISKVDPDEGPGRMRLIAAGLGLLHELIAATGATCRDDTCEICSEVATRDCGDPDCDACARRRAARAALPLH